MNVKVNRYEKTIPFLLSTVVLVCLTSCSQAPGKSLTLDARVSSSISDDYETGNYGSFEYDHVSFGYYRANGKKKDSLVSLSSFATPYGETLGGSFYNTSIIDGIQKIAVQYMTSATEGKDKPTIFFGAHEYSSCQDLNYSST